MSANRATTQKLGFHRWVASLKRETPVAGSGPPLSAPPSATPIAPPSRQKFSSAPRAELEPDDATRVHHIPKEIIHRMRARAASDSLKPPQDEQTCVFRAPPELLERAKRAPVRSEPPTEAPAAPEPASVSDTDFDEMLDAESGISVRRQAHPPSTRHLEVGQIAGGLDDGSELQDGEEWHDGDEPSHDAHQLHDGQKPQDADDPEDDETNTAGLAPHAAVPPASHADRAASVSTSDLLSTASSDRLSEAPSFRQPVGGKLLFAALMVAVAVLLVWSTR